jgi:hypothetical protein
MDKDYKSFGYLFGSSYYPKTDQVGLQQTSHPYQPVASYVGETYIVRRPYSTLLEAARHGAGSDSVLLEFSFHPEEPPFDKTCKGTVLWQADARDLVQRMGLWSAKELIREFGKLGYNLPDEVINAVKEKQTWIENGGASNKTQSPPELALKIFDLVDNRVGERTKITQKEKEEYRAWTTLARVLLHWPVGPPEPKERFIFPISDERLSKELERRVKELKRKTLETQITL